MIESLHRNNKGQLHYNDGPAISYSNGNYFHYNNGLRHNSNGPAVREGLTESSFIKGVEYPNKIWENLQAYLEFSNEDYIIWLKTTPDIIKTSLIESIFEPK